MVRLLSAGLSFSLLALLVYSGCSSEPAGQADLYTKEQAHQTGAPTGCGDGHLQGAPVHEWIAGQAFWLWPGDVDPAAFTEMLPYVGSPDYYDINALYPIEGDYSVFGPFPVPTRTFNPQNSLILGARDSDYRDLHGLLGYYGDFRSCFAVDQDCVCGGLDSLLCCVFTGLFDADSSCYSLGFVAHPGANHFWNPHNDFRQLPESFLDNLLKAGGRHSAIALALKEFQIATEQYLLGNKTVAFYYIGHIAHLLTDMSVPAHTMVQDHDPDFFEKYLSAYNLDVSDDFQYKKFGLIDAEHVVNPSELNYNVLPDSWEPTIHLYSRPVPDTGLESKLFNIFFSLAEISDNFGNQVERSPSHLWESDYKQCQDQLQPNCSNILYACRKEFGLWFNCDSYQEVLEGEAIRHVAALYRLFWEATHGDPATPASLVVSTNLINVGTLPWGATYQESFGVLNGGDGTLSWSVMTNDAWVGLSPSSGQSTGDIDTVIMTINTRELLCGEPFASMITVYSNAGPALVELIGTVSDVGCTYPPDLRSGDVEPETGTIDSTFHFTVEYQNQNGEAPATIECIIERPTGGNLTYSMAPGGNDFTLWTEFSVDVSGQSIGEGTSFRYRFEAETTGGTDTRGPFNGPDVFSDVEPFVTCGPYVSANVSAGDTYGIEYESRGCSRVSLFYDGDRDSGNGMQMIVQDLVELAGAYSWSTAGVPEGAYYIYATCSNNQGQSDWHYSGAKVAIGSYHLSEKYWGPPTVIADGGNYPEITTSVPDGVVHVYWLQGQSLMLRVSNDNGDTFGTPIVVATVAANYYIDNFYQADADNQGNVHLVISGGEDAALDWWIKYVKVGPDGSIMIPAKTIVAAPEFRRDPVVDVDESGAVHVAWQDYTPDLHLSDIWYSHSTDGGNTFSTAVKILQSDGLYEVRHPSISAEGGCINVAAAMDQSDVDMLLHVRSTNGGDSFGSVGNLGGAYNAAQQPSLTANGQVVHLAYSGSSGQEAYRRSSDCGSSWSITTELPLVQTNRPDIAANATGVYFIADSGDIPQFTESLDGGISWTIGTQLPVPPIGREPRIDVGVDGVVHIVTYDLVNSDIIYMKSVPGEACPELAFTSPAVGVNYCSDTFDISWAGQDANLTDVPTVRLFYDADEIPGGLMEITGAVDLPASGTFTWDTSTMLGGTYFVVAEITDGLCTKKVYSDGFVSVNRSPGISVTAPATSQERANPFYEIRWTSSDPEDDPVMVSLYYDDNTDPSSKNIIAHSIMDAERYSWNASSLPHGTEYYVYALVSDGINPPVGDYSTGTILVDLPDHDCLFDADCQSPDTCIDGFCQCVPDCVGRNCGTDGCSGSCGDCTAPEVCNDQGLCACAPDCGGRECGADPVCGTSCGSCTAPDFCSVQGQCDCPPDCTGRECGPDPVCSVSCGSCVAPESCGEDGMCSCTPACTGRECGDDGCGGSCGICDIGSGEVCVIATGQCDLCTPNCTGRECGLDPTCGSSCGSCIAPETCGGGGAPNVCGCSPQCTGKCAGPDSCGGDCPDTCTAPNTCGGGGTNDVCGCLPDCTAKECGDNGCGGSCGSCASLEVCQGNQCQPEGRDEPDGCGCGSGNEENQGVYLLGLGWAFFASKRRRK